MNNNNKLNYSKIRIYSVFFMAISMIFSILILAINPVIDPFYLAFSISNFFLGVIFLTHALEINRKEKKYTFLIYLLIIIFLFYIGIKYLLKIIL